MAARSYLFVPGDRAEMLAGAAARGADALVVDLEDGVAPAARSAARATVAAWLADCGGGDGPERWVRVDRHALAADVEAVVDGAVSGIVVPKLRTTTDLQMAAELLANAESQHVLPHGSLGLLPLIETAAALADLPAIAAAPRVRRLMIGEMDLGAELGIHFDDWDLWLPIRLQLVVASAAAGLPGPIGPVDRDFSDPAKLRHDTAALRRMGFRARAAIHPAQIPPINDAMTPSPAEVESAARLVEWFDAALASGRGAAVDDAGRMVDEATVRAARDVLDAAGPGAPTG